MNRFHKMSCHGFALLELLMVLVILGALASIAIPQYAEYKTRGYNAQCESNRYHIELEERAHYMEHGSPGLMIDDKYKCPSNGIYVWLVSDPDDPDYPRIGCSVHYIGENGSTESPESPPGNESAEKAIQDLIDYIIEMNLDKGIEESMLSKLTSASAFIEKDQNASAISDLESLIHFSEAQKGKKLPIDEADTIISKVQQVIEMITS